MIIALLSTATQRRHDIISCIYSNISFVYSRVAQNLIYFTIALFFIFALALGHSKIYISLVFFFLTGFGCAIFKTKSVSVAAQCTFHLWLINLARTH